MYKVFLSSTSRDLQAYRNAVREAIARLDGFEVVGMEDFLARNAAPKAFCVRRVRESHILVGLLGHLYGSRPPGETTSFAEIEYQTARDAGRPRLMFVAPKDFQIPANLRESDASAECQRRFRQEAEADRVVASFATPEQLASAVTQSLANWREEQRQAREAAAMGLTEASAHFAGAVDAEKPIGPNPYRGLEAFHKGDAARFFGRETLVHDLWERFIGLHAPARDETARVRLLTILGPSGTGKSSVAQAGLLAALDEHPLPGRPATPSVVFTPEARPLESLAVALAREATGDPAPAQKAIEFEKVLRERPHGDGLRFLAAQLLGKAGIVLLVDQFEEIYALCEDHGERNAFIDNLLNAARAPNGGVSVILTLRSDFLGAVDHHPELFGLIVKQNRDVPVMSEEELRRAIEKPAWDAGHSIDPDVVQSLLEQVRGHEGALTHLEFLLARIWEGFRKGASAADTVRELGGLGGALATAAQGVYDTLREEEREIARRAFLAMVRFEERTEYPRRARLSEILAKGETEDRVLQVLRRFAMPECRLIVLADTGRAITAEVAHEALFDHWHLLRTWLDAERDALRLKLQPLRLVETSTFRLALINFALFAISALALLGVLYVATAGIRERETQDIVRAEITGLAEQYRAEGLTHLKEMIEQRSAARPLSVSVYLLVDPLGRGIAGNLDRWPDVEPGPDGWLTFTVEVRGGGADLERRRARAASVNLSGGFRLLVGRDVEDRLQSQSQINQLIGWGLLLTLLLGLFGTFVMIRAILRPLDEINETIRRITWGELGLRFARSDFRDEFAQLAANLNAMLDALDTLHPQNPETKREQESFSWSRRSQIGRENGYERRSRRD